MCVLNNNISFIEVLSRSADEVYLKYTVQYTYCEVYFKHTSCSAYLMYTFLVTKSYVLKIYFLYKQTIGTS